MTATVEGQPTQPTVALVSQEDALKAISQLTSLIVGGKIAKETSYLTNEPLKRVESCVEKVLQEYQQNSGDTKAAGTLQRKLSSLDSIKTMAKLLTEIEF